MKESEQSINQKKLNDAYLKLLFSPEVKKTLNKNKSFYNQMNLLFSFILNGRIKELIIRVKSRKKGGNIKCNRDIGVIYHDDDDREYAGTKKVAVYTAIFESNIPINEPMFCNPDYDYYIFTDQKLADNSHWKNAKYNKDELPAGLNGAEKNRWFKLHPHLYFQRYDISVYVDGGIILIADVMPWIEALDGRILGTHVMSLAIDSVYESAKTVISSKKAPREKVLAQMKKYKEEGYPDHNGMYENGVLVRAHMNMKCIDLMEQWWEQMVMHTMRDQLSLGYILWKNNISKDEILLLGDNIFTNPRIRFWDL